MKVTDVIFAGSDDEQRSFAEKMMAETIKALIAEAVAAEREACAVIAERWALGTDEGTEIAKKLRERGT